MPCSSLLIPAIIPLNLYLFIIFLRPSVFRAAERAAGGSEESICSMGGQSPLIRLSPHSLTNLSRNKYISLNFFPVSTCTKGKGIFPKNALNANHTITFESLPNDHKSAIFCKDLNACLKI